MTHVEMISSAICIQRWESVSGGKKQSKRRGSNWLTLMSLKTLVVRDAGMDEGNEERLTKATRKGALSE